MLVYHKIFYVNEAVFFEEDPRIGPFLQRTIPTVDGDEISGEKTTLGYIEKLPTRAKPHLPTNRLNWESPDVS